MQYRLSRKVMTEDSLRKSYNELTKKTYGFDFEQWYRDGYWSESNIPYTLFDGEKAIANVSVNRMEVHWQGKVRRYIQIGTVMTDEAYRHRGLSRFLMEEIKKDWENRCDAMFLFANDSVLDFYPKFGFVREKQYQFTGKFGQASDTARKSEQASDTARKSEQASDTARKSEQASGIVRKLDMAEAGDRVLLQHYYEKTNPFSALQVLHNFGLLMFYCGSFMKDCIYYDEKQDAVVIGEQEEDVFRCYDVYCDEGKNLMEILRAAAAAETETVSLEFTPKDANGFLMRQLEDDDNALFVLAGGENIFRGEKLRFPEIAHT